MSCKDVIELVEPIAAGDIEAGNDVRMHVETCPACAAALASARRLDAALATRHAVLPPPRFTAGVMQRIRRERWRAEQHVDRLFNVAMVLAFVIVAGGVVALMNLSGVLAAATQTVSIMASLRGDIARSAVPSLATYIAAGGLLASALAMWWWAERRVSL